jgi:hypothetical protein
MVGANGGLVPQTWCLRATKPDGPVLRFGSLVLTLGAAVATKPDGSELMLGWLLKLGAGLRPNWMARC